MKTCSKCKAEKPLNDFGKSKASKDGLQYNCKSCNSAYYQNNKEQRRGYRETNKEKLKEYNREYRKNNKEKLKESAREYWKDNKDWLSERNREYNREYKKNNKEKINEREGKRRESDYFFKMKCNLRTRTYLAFKRKKWFKGKGTEKMLGTTFDIAHKHISRQFTEGMSWNNYGEWHIDHIIPLASANTEDELIKLCHYTNLQPLWAADNLAKGSKILPY
jgi:hypothetical protein